MDVPKRSLEVAMPSPEPGRRQVLLLACSACGLAACPPGPSDGDILGTDATDTALDGPDALQDSATDGSACTGVDVGAITDFPLGSFRRIDTASVIVAHVDAGLYAYRSTCTHFGVQIPAPTGGVSICPPAMGGHSSAFDTEGRHINGTGLAMADIANLRVLVCGDRVRVVISNSGVVPIGTRTPVP